MSEKILFTDLDGTLLNSAKKVSPGTVSYTHLTLPTKA